MQFQAINNAYSAIKQGGLAIIPSRVGYTLLGNSDSSIRKMYNIKGRPLSKPCVLLTTLSDMCEMAEVQGEHIRLIQAIDRRQLLCGFILKRKEHPTLSTLPKWTNRQSQKDNTSCYVIHGGKYIEHLVTLAKADGIMIVGSSANKSGTGNEGHFKRIPVEIRSSVDAYVNDDEYVHHEYNPMTREQGVMIDLTGNRPQIIRKGFQHQTILQHLERHLEETALS